MSLSLKALAIFALQAISCSCAYLKKHPEEIKALEDAAIYGGGRCQQERLIVQPEGAPHAMGIPNAVH